MKRLIGIVIMLSIIVAVGTAYAAELTVGSRYYTKFLDKNSHSQSDYVTTGNGKGIRSELELTLNGKVSDRAEMGARVLTVWDPSGITGNYSDWGGWFNGYANLWQVRGMWVRFRPATVPTLKSILVGTSDLGMFNPWTIGKIRWIDRDNARIVYAEGAFGPATYGIGALPMPTWWGPSWNTCVGMGTTGDPRDAWATAATLAIPVNKTLNVKIAASHVQAVTAEAADPTLGKTVYDNAVETLDISWQPNPVYNVSGLIGYSNYSADNTILVSPQTWWPAIPYANVTGTALKLDATADDPLGIGLTLKGEYFNISPDFVSIMAARRETKVLLSEGHVRYAAGTNGSTWRGDVGYTPSQFTDNGITDWNETNYQSCAGLNGITIVPEYKAGALGIKGEVSMFQDGLNSQAVDTTKYFWSNAMRDQSSNLYALRVDYLLPIRNGISLFAKYKMANWKDGVNSASATDDLARDDTEMYAGASYQINDEIGITGGYKTLQYVSKGFGGNPNLKTTNTDAGMIFAEVKANVGGTDIAWALEKVDGTDKPDPGAPGASSTIKDVRIKATVEVKI